VTELPLLPLQLEYQTGRFVMGLQKAILRHRSKRVANDVTVLEGKIARANNAI